MVVPTYDSPMRLLQRFTNLPIERKLLLVSVIPILTLVVLSFVTYKSVQRFAQDEDRLNHVYLVQTTAAEYMRLIVDLETGFRGFVMTQQPSFLNPYFAAKQRVLSLGQTLAQMVQHDETQQVQIESAQALVEQLLRDKEMLIEQVKNGHPEVALHYIESGTGRGLMLAIREEIAQFDRRESDVLSRTLARTGHDRSLLLGVVVAGGSFALLPMMLALHLLARSIADPLVALAKTVENHPGERVPDVTVLDRGDEIGDLTRVMHEMTQQIRDYIGQIEKSEFDLRALNTDLSISESKYRGIVDHAPFGIFAAAEGRIIFCNRHNWVLAGRTPDDSLDPEEMWKAIHPADREHVAKAFKEACEKRITFDYVFRFLHPDGSECKILSRAVPIEDRAGLEPLYQGFNVDITALEQMREKLSRSERLATLGQVAAGIAHEIRNPLVGIGSTTSLLMEDLPADDSRRGDLATILKEIRRLDRIVTQIVEYARPRDIIPCSFDLRALIEESVNVIRTPLEQKLIHMTYDIPSTVPMLYADRDQIKQVILNGIQNAMEALPPEGTCHISAYEDMRHGDSGIRIDIRDNGKGIMPADLPKIFDPFFTTGKRQGTGLGLAICRNIIEAHGGDIQAQSWTGEGTVLSIWLPITPSPHLSMAT